MSKGPFSPSQFIPTKWSTAEDKARFGNALLHFVDSCFARSLFTDRLYGRLFNEMGVLLVMRSRKERVRRLRRSANCSSWISGNESAAHQACSAQLLPDIKSSEQSEEENGTGNHRRLDAERKNAGGHCRLQMDIDGHAHLAEEEQAGDQ